MVQFISGIRNKHFSFCSHKTEDVCCHMHELNLIGQDLQQMLIYDLSAVMSNYTS